MRALSLLAGALALLPLTPVAAEDLRPPLVASVAFTGPDGGALDRIAAKEPFGIAVQVENRLGSDPPAGLTLSGWLRPVSDSNLTCTEAARSYLATGRLPAGAVKLNGPLIGVAGTDGAFVIADPELDLASANLVGAATLPEVPDDLVADPDGGRMIATLSGRGEILSLAVPDAASRTLAQGLDRPVAAFGAPDGAVWVLEAGTRRALRILPGGPPQVLMEHAVALTRASAGDSFAIAGTGHTGLYQSRDGAPLIVLATGSDAALALSDPDGTFALARLSGDRLDIHYTDAPDQPVAVALPSPVSRLVAGPGGRWILGHDPGRAAPTLLIDVARGRVIQSVSAGVPVSEIAFTDRAAYLMLADQSRVGVLDLAAIDGDSATPLRDVMLGQARERLLDHAGYLVPLWPQPGMLAVHAESYTGFVIHDYAMMGDAPPMTALRLRGGVPQRVVAFDRSFREAAPGLFRTMAVLDTPGDYELVATTGIGALSFCARLPAMPGTTTSADTAPGYLTAQRLPGDPAQVRLTFLSDAGTPVANGVFQVLVTSLATPWRAVTPLRSDQTGQATYPLPVPAGGPVVIAVAAGDGSRFHPLILE